MATRIAIAVGWLLCIPVLASAHPGHGLDPSGSSLLHYVSEPEHVLPLLGALGVAALLWSLAALSRRSG